MKASEGEKYGLGLVEKVFERQRDEREIGEQNKLRVEGKKEWEAERVTE